MDGCVVYGLLLELGLLLSDINDVFMSCMSKEWEKKSHREPSVFNHLFTFCASWIGWRQPFSAAAATTTTAVVSVDVFFVRLLSSLIHCHGPRESLEVDECKICWRRLVVDMFYPSKGFLLLSLCSSWVRFNNGSVWGWGWVRWRQAPKWWWCYIKRS